VRRAPKCNAGYDVNRRPELRSLGAGVGQSGLAEQPPWQQLYGRLAEHLD
jgi:hypothetical protein